MKPHVDILMATYNGAAYLKPQIYSILSQTFVDWTLYIHDDGSKDETVSIIKHFCKQDKRITFIEDGIHFGSAPLNFMHLLYFATSELICFCDQDDIWMENKLERLIFFSQNFKTNKPSVWCSEGYLLYSGFLIRGRINYKITKIQDLLFINGGIHGSRCMINNLMKEALCLYKGTLNMHDHIMALIATTFGDIFYLDEPLFLYRQHLSNLSGQYESRPFYRLLKGFKMMFKKGVVLKNVYQSTEIFYKIYFNYLSPKNRILIDTYLKFPRFGFLIKCFFILKYKYSIRGSKIKLFCKLVTRNFFYE